LGNSACFYTLAQPKLLLYEKNVSCFVFQISFNVHSKAQATLAQTDRAKSKAKKPSATTTTTKPATTTAVAKPASTTKQTLAGPTKKTGLQICVINQTKTQLRQPLQPCIPKKTEHLINAIKKINSKK
jgi:hypothetical protein